MGPRLQVNAVELLLSQHEVTFDMALDLSKCVKYLFHVGSNLTRLSLSSMRMTDHSLIVIIAALDENISINSRACLRYLDISKNNLTSKSWTWLVRSEAISTLLSLDISGIPLLTSDVEEFILYYENYIESKLVSLIFTDSDHLDRTKVAALREIVSERKRRFLSYCDNQERNNRQTPIRNSFVTVFTNESIGVFSKLPKEKRTVLVVGETVNGKFTLTNLSTDPTIKHHPLDIVDLCTQNAILNYLNEPRLQDTLLTEIDPDAATEYLQGFLVGFRREQYVTRIVNLSNEMLVNISMFYPQKQMCLFILNEKTSLLEREIIDFELKTVNSSSEFLPQSSEQNKLRRLGKILKKHCKSKVIDQHQWKTMMNFFAEGPLHIHRKIPKSSPVVSLGFGLLVEELELIETNWLDVESALSSTEDSDYVSYMREKFPVIIKRAYYNRTVKLPTGYVTLIFKSMGAALAYYYHLQLFIEGHNISAIDLSLKHVSPELEISSTNNANQVLSFARHIHSHVYNSEESAAYTVESSLPANRRQKSLKIDLEGMLFET